MLLTGLVILSITWRTASEDEGFNAKASISVQGYHLERSLSVRSLKVYRQSSNLQGALSITAKSRCRYSIAVRDPKSDSMVGFITSNFQLIFADLGQSTLISMSMWQQKSSCRTSGPKKHLSKTAGRRRKAFLRSRHIRSVLCRYHRYKTPMLLV